MAPDSSNVSLNEFVNWAFGEVLSQLKKREKKDIPEAHGRGWAAIDVPPGIKIYLDTKYWIEIRRKLFLEGGDSCAGQVIDFLTDRLSSGEIALPISGEHLDEFGRQSKMSASRMGEVVDRFARQLCISGYGDRCFQELLLWAFNLDRTRGFDLFSLCSEAVWCKPIGLILRHDLSQNCPKQLSASSWDRVVGLMEGVLRDMPFSMLLDGFVETPYNHDRPKELADHLNAVVGKRDIDELRATFQSECVGYFKSVSCQIDSSIYLKGIGGLERAIVESFCLSSRSVSALIDSVIFEPGNILVPTLQVVAAANSSMRIQKRRKFKAGDAIDLQHASAAIGYCDVFVTDRSMAHLINTKPFLDLCGQGRCRIVGSWGEMMELVQGLLAQ